jgi:hypothetical protein
MPEPANPILSRLKTAANAYAEGGETRTLLEEAAEEIRKGEDERMMWRNLNIQIANKYNELRSLVQVALAPMPEELRKLPPNLKLTQPPTTPSR